MRAKTAELIRPILRGRDIKRYGYEWANLWLIATFPSRNYDIDEYPSVRDYLLTFGIEKLEQTGRTHIVNGETIKARKKTNNKWFETQDSISYWDDFNQPKVVWARLMRIAKGATTSFPRFASVPEGMFVVDSLCFFVGKQLDEICTVLNSEYATYYYFRNIAILDNGGMQMRQQYIEEIPLPRNLTNDIYDEFHFSKEEREFIRNYIISRYQDISDTER